MYFKLTHTSYHISWQDLFHHGHNYTRYTLAANVMEPFVSTWMQMLPQKGSLLYDAVLSAGNAPAMVYLTHMDVMPPEINPNK